MEMLVTIEKYALQFRKLFDLTQKRWSKWTFFNVCKYARLTTSSLCCVLSQQLLNSTLDFGFIIAAMSLYHRKVRIAANKIVLQQSNVIH